MTETEGKVETAMTSSHLMHSPLSTLPIMWKSGNTLQLETCHTYDKHTNQDHMTVCAQIKWHIKLACPRHPAVAAL